MHVRGYSRKLRNFHVPRERGFRHSMEFLARGIPKTLEDSRWSARQKLIHLRGYPRKLRNFNVPRENGFRRSMGSLAPSLPNAKGAQGGWRAKNSSMGRAVPESSEISTFLERMDFGIRWNLWRAPFRKHEGTQGGWRA